MLDEFGPRKLPLVTSAVSASAPALAEVLSDPFDPDRSLQLNRRHWPMEPFRWLSEVRAAEQALQTDDQQGFRQALSAISPGLFGSSFLDAVLWRARRLSVGRQALGYATGWVDVAQVGPHLQFKARSPIEGIQGAPLPRQFRDAFSPMLRTVASLHAIHFGPDIRTIHLSTRYAGTDAEAALLREHEPLLDYHFDGYGDINAVCYLHDVTPGDGPFEFVEGSHFVPQSIVIKSIHEHLFFDRNLSRPVDLECVPLEFRGTPRISNFIDPEKTRELLRYQRMFQAPKGGYIVFDGRYLLHRGGVPMNGSRLAAFAHTVSQIRGRIDRWIAPSAIQSVGWL